MATIWTKYPAEVLDYEIDFTARLADGETIESTEVSTTGDVLADREAKQGAVVRFWLSGGTGPAVSSVACVIVTSAGRTIEVKVPFRIID